MEEKGHSMMRIPGILFGVAILIAASVHAAQKEEGDLARILLDKGVITQEQYDRLQKEASETENRHVDVKLTTDGGIRASTYDGKFAFRLGGVVASDLALHNEDKNALGNGTEIRSARIEMQGTFFSDWDYEFSMEFADAEAEIKDAFVRYAGLQSLAFQFGQFKAPFSIEEMGPRKHTTFIERALSNALVPGRRMGAGVSYQGSLWTLAAGVFGEEYNADADNEGDEGWMTSGRFTFAPIHSQNRVFHFGVSAAYQVPNDAKVIKIDSKPESRLTGASFLDTGKIKNVDNAFAYGIETAMVWGPFSLQGEYVRQSLDIKNSGASPDFYGGYAFASWMITGESRDYKFGKGSFGRVKPDRTYGAFEVAVRYSTLNLNSFPVVAGGRENNVTLGLNWYVNRNIRAMANYLIINNDAFASDRGNLLGNDDPGIFHARLQIDF